MDRYQLKLAQGSSWALNAFIYPTETNNRNIMWSSSDASIAKVDDKGLVTAIIPGTTTITASIKNNKSIHAQCIVKVFNANGYEYVDMKLPSGTLWATCNIGASYPHFPGAYFAWGETIQKNEYTWDNLTYCLDSNGYMFSKYVTDSKYGTIDNKTELDLCDDAAHVNWGGDWRMPSKEQLDELVQECIWSLLDRNGNKCFYITSKTNGESIILPVTGYLDTSLKDYTYFGYYWSRSIDKRSPFYAVDLAFLYNGYNVVQTMPRYKGINVRAVLE